MCHMCLPKEEGPLAQHVQHELRLLLERLFPRREDHQLTFKSIDFHRFSPTFVWILLNFVAFSMSFLG